MKNYSILFVCMGNICRSPTAEGVFRRVLSESPTITNKLNVSIDSAGTIGYHVGEHPDSRAIRAAKLRGYDISKLIARQTRASDFEEYDLILVMDNDNLISLQKQAVSSAMQQHHHKVRLFLEFSKQSKVTEVPDPYYGESDGFNLVIDLIEDASAGLIDYLAQQS